MVKAIYLFCTALLFMMLGCQSVDHSDDIRRSLDKEILSRFQQLHTISQGDDSLRLLVAGIQKQAERLMLMSCDVENPASSISEANTYFRLLASALPMGHNGPELMQPGMNSKQLQLGILQNELWVLNNLLFLHGENEIKLFSTFSGSSEN